MANPYNLATPEGFERLDRTYFRERVYGMDGNDLEKGV